MADLVTSFRRIKPAIVAIARRRPGEDPGSPFALQVIGTGFNVDPCGIVVTCRHVVESFLTTGGQESPILAVFVTVNLERGEVEFVQSPILPRISLLGAHQDVALIRLRNPNLLLPSLALGSAGDVHEGTRVIACGYPLGLALQEYAGSVSSTFQAGIVASVIPHPEMPLAKRQFYRLDMPLNPGNSGGPVILEENGTVVGIVYERPEDKCVVEIEGCGPTDLRVGVSAGLTHALPIEFADPRFVDLLRRLTFVEIEARKNGGPWPRWFAEELDETPGEGTISGTGGSQTLKAVE